MAKVKKIAGTKCLRIDIMAKQAGGDPDYIVMINGCRADPVDEARILQIAYAFRENDTQEMFTHDPMLGYWEKVNGKGN